MKLTRFKLAFLSYALFDLLIGGHCGGLLPLGDVAAAQQSPVQGNITAASSSCLSTNCVTAQLDGQTGAASIQLTGTFALTSQFEVSNDNGSTFAALSCTPTNSTTAVSSATATGLWQCNVAGFTHIRVRGSAYTSGTAVVYINSARVSAKSGGPFSSGGLTANLLTKSDGAGKLKDSTIVDDGAGNITIPGAIANQGTLTISQLATPANATLVVTGGVGTNYTYKLVAKAGSVGTAANSGVSTAVGPTTLDGTHFIDINFVSQTGCTSIDVYRTVGGAAQGKIGNVACGAAGAALTLRDNALVGDASPAPAADNEVVTIAEPIALGTNPSTSGNINLPNTGSIAGRNAANNADVQIASVRSDNGVALGPDYIDAYSTQVIPGADATRSLGSTSQRWNGFFTNSITNQTGNGAQWVQGQGSELLTLSTSGTTTDTAASLLPGNSIILGVVARVTTTITTATSWQLGDPTTAGRFTTANATMTAGTTDIGKVHLTTGIASATTGIWQAASAKVRVTTVGTPGAGAIRITVFYMQLVPPTS